MARGGIPLIYMGDEVGLINDDTYLQDPEKAHDSRWLHRPRMDWAKVDRRLDPHSAEGRLFAGLCKLIQARKSTPLLHNFALYQPMWTDNVHVLAFGRRRHEGNLLVLANFDEHPQSVQDDLPYKAGVVTAVRNLLADTPLNIGNGRIHLEPHESLWLAGED
jgi:amylosucrase